MERFIANNRDELIARCKAKVAQRPRRAATEEQLKNGVPLFLEQLRRTLVAEASGQVAEIRRISGASNCDGLAKSEMGVSATAHGKQLLQLGFSVDQLVHGYGDLCQAITELACERATPFSVEQFRTLNRCLDNAIADAVTAFSLERDLHLAGEQSAEVTRRLGALVHELRNSAGTAKLAFAALQTGHLSVSGATGTVLGRSLDALTTLLEGALEDVRAEVDTASQKESFSLFAFVADVGRAAALDAVSRGCQLTVTPISPEIGISGNRERLSGALANLLQNAFKFTRPGTEVTLNAYASGERVFIDVADHCGGLPPGQAEKMFAPFSQRSTDKTGLGLGLTIARESVEEAAGTLSVENLPGRGCVFKMRLPRRALRH